MIFVTSKMNSLVTLLLAAVNYFLKKRNFRYGRFSGSSFGHI